MQLTLKSTRLPLTAKLRDYCQAKIDKTEKYLGKFRPVNCEMEVARVGGDQRTGEIFRAEVNLQLPRQLLRVERTAADLYKAIDKCQEHLKLVIKKYKDKLTTRKRAV